MADEVEDENPGLGKGERPKTLDAAEAIRSKRLLLRRRQLPRPTGFSYIEVSAVYSTVRHVLTLVCTARPRGDNHGPGIFYRKSVPWKRKMSETGAVVKLVEAELESLQQQITSRALPERDLFLEKCNTAGTPLDRFLSETCSKCSCWYCDLAS